MRDIARFFVRYQIDPENLLYLTREEQRTVLHLLDGSTVTTSIPQKEIRAWLGDEDFINICKGVTVRKDQIVDISRAGVYTMTDGRTFQGRQRHLAEHKLLRQELMPLSSERGDEAPKSLLKKCTLMDALPLAFCVIELTFDAAGHGVDFVFRYCNPMMAVVEGVPVENMVNRSFYEVFPDGDRKWLVSCADTALNGSCHTLRDYSRELEQNLTIHCYQPELGYCACLLLPED